MKKIVSLLLVFFMSTASAEIQVAFFRCYDWNGNLIQFEEGGEFCHVAIQYRRGWIHAHPIRGVEFQKSLSEIPVGKLGKVLFNPEESALTHEEVEPWIGIPYDPTFSWKTPSKTYCSKLVGNLLEVPPKIMKFETPYWKKFKNLPQNELGISPDGVYANLLRRGFGILGKAKQEH